MSFWGKIVGGAIGFVALGGPLGALMGMAAGHLVDNAVRRRKRIEADPFASDQPDALDNMQAACMVALIALSAKLAKADGQVTRAEVDALKRVIQIPDAFADEVRKIYNTARESADGYEPYAQQIANILGNNRQVLESILGALIMIANVDGSYHIAERRMIAGIGQIFGFATSDIQRIEHTFVASIRPGEDDPYEILEVDRDASDDAVRSAHRKLLRTYHPDTVIAKGMPAEFIEVANQKMAKINAAYDRIKEERGLT